MARVLWLDPLTHWENSIRSKQGSGVYDSGFVEHYLIPILYPEGLTRPIQIALGSVVVVFNIAIYSILINRILDSSSRQGSGTRFGTRLPGN